MTACNSKKHYQRFHGLYKSRIMRLRAYVCAKNAKKGDRMQNKDKMIKKAFAEYRQNKKRLSEMQFETLRGRDYNTAKTKIRTGQETALVSYIDSKAAIEKAVEIVERTLYHYEIYERAYADGKAQYIRCRFVQGMGFTRAGVECGVPDSTACFWYSDIRETAAAIADLYNLWAI